VRAKYVIFNGFVVVVVVEDKKSVKDEEKKQGKSSLKQSVEI